MLAWSVREKGRQFAIGLQSAQAAIDNVQSLSMNAVSSDRPTAASPPRSLLGMGAGLRLAGAVVLMAVLCLAAWWAMLE
ncbi:hypothetical protein [Pseudacidovorax intermedius]|uniref:hypothetical protein n=1 Tax=Pseudacidovorax intermedius TaxID=433924 RepID=UPI00128F6200|nr:hypothetical protein [Pseudacidovorax intermedius]